MKRSNKLQVVLHVRRVLKRSEECPLQGDSFIREGDCWDLGRTNSPTSARHRDGVGFIRICATLPKRLVFWDGAPSPYKWYQSQAPNLVMCVDDVRSPQGAVEGAMGPCSL